MADNFAAHGCVYGSSAGRLSYSWRTEVFGPLSLTLTGTTGSPWRFQSQHLRLMASVQSRMLKLHRFHIRNFSTHWNRFGLHEIFVHPRSLLSAAARKPMAGGDRVAGFGLSLPRLERAHHGRMLRGQRRQRAFSTTSSESRRIINNYSRISFNFGPTLLAWAKTKAPDLYTGDPRSRPAEPGALTAVTARRSLRSTTT